MVGILAFLPLITKVLDKVLPDTAQRQAVLAELERTEEAHDFKITEDQIAVNKEEAKNESLFVSGWRPAIGWLCGIAMAWNYILQPVLLFTLASMGVDVSHITQIPSSDLMNVLLGLLGLGSLRTIEKIKRK